MDPICKSCGTTSGSLSSRTVAKVLTTLFKQGACTFTKFRDLSHPPLPPRDFSLLLGRCNNGFQILFHDNTKIELERGAGLLELRNIKCMKLYPLGIVTVYPDGKIRSRNTSPFILHYFIIICQNKCTSGRENASFIKHLVRKQLCSNTGACTTLFPTSACKAISFPH